MALVMEAFTAWPDLVRESIVSDFNRYTRETGTITDYDSTSVTCTFAASTFTAGAGANDAWVIF